MIRVLFPSSKRCAVLAIGLLLSFFAYVNASQSVIIQNDANRQLLQFCMSKVRGNAEEAQLFIEQGADSNVMDTHGVTALMWAAQNGRVDLCQVLIAAKADINVANELGDKALMIAARSGLLEICIMLTNAGADLISPTALKCAAQAGRVALCKLLLRGMFSQLLLRKGKEDVIPEQFSLVENDIQIVLKENLDVAFRMCDIPEMSSLLDPAHIGDNFFELLVATLYKEDVSLELIDACRKKANTENIRLLLVRGADPNVRFAGGTTPFIFAAEHRLIPLCTLLCDGGADVNTQDSEGLTALMRLVNFRDRIKICRFQLMGMCKFLLEEGVNPFIENKEGNTALTMAAMNPGDLLLCKLILRYMLLFLLEPRLEHPTKLVAKDFANDRRSYQNFCCSFRAGYERWLNGGMLRDRLGEANQRILFAAHLQAYEHCNASGLKEQLNPVAENFEELFMKAL